MSVKGLEPVLVGAIRDFRARSMGLLTGNSIRLAKTGFARANRDGKAGDVGVTG